MAVYCHDFSAFLLSPAFVRAHRASPLHCRGVLKSPNGINKSFEEDGGVKRGKGGFFFFFFFKHTL